jgi:hypothetical protein
VTARTRAPRWRLLVSQALLLLMAWSSVAPALHGAGHDQDCDPALVFHDESQHRFAAASPGPDVHSGDHCLACHLFRGSRHATAWKFVPQALASSRLALHVTSEVISAGAVSPLPSRAPPALV